MLSASIFTSLDTTLKNISKAVMRIILNDRVPVEALTDSGSSRSFIWPEVVPFADLKMLPATGSLLGLYSIDYSIDKRGYCWASVAVKDKMCEGVQLHVMKSLFTCPVRPQLAKEHKSVCQVWESWPLLEPCCLAVATVDPPTLFWNLLPKYGAIIVSS